MEFYTATGHKRPVRLSEATRKFAYESLYGKYGRDSMNMTNVSLAHIEGYEAMSAIERYDCAMREIVKNAPVRICDGEMISGAATLGDAISHQLPAVYADESRGWDTGASHLTADFAEVLAIGMDGVRAKAEAALEQHTDDKKNAFVRSCIHCIDCMKIWHGRYIEELKKRPGFERNVDNLMTVPFKPAENFYQAVQSIWLCFAFLRLGGCWPGIGRIDVLLGDYLKADLATGALTIEEAREILAHFFIKGCEWIGGKDCFDGSGDAQHYQNIVLSGIDADGCDVTNEVTYLVLDIVEETGISDFPITVRINPRTDKKLLDRVSEVISYGGGTVAVYNEELVIRSLVDMGYSKVEAAGFANDGCWEVQIPGRTNFSYVPFDSLKLLQSVTLKDYDAEFGDFDSLLSCYMDDLRGQVKAIFDEFVLTKLDDEKTAFRENHPCTAISLFEHSCIERGLSYKEGGTDYFVVSPHIGGLPDCVNSLYAIKKAVFEDGIVSFREFMSILKNNWKDGELLRKKVSNYSYYGNDNDEVDMLVAKILGEFSDMCKEYDGTTPIRFVSGVSTFGRQIEWAPERSATPFGRKMGEVLSGNLSPTPGTDAKGATAIIKSHCKADLVKQHTGAALDISLIGGGDVSAISGLIMGFVALGGFFMQIDVSDRKILEEAQKHPENYPNLAVRVSGWSARFVTLSREWQDMIIGRMK